MNTLNQKASALKLHGLIAHWDEIQDTSWLEQLLTWEEEERSRRSLEHRMQKARLGRFKPLAQFDWNWPKKCDRACIENWMRLSFVDEATNLILCGPNGAGKTTIACNVAHQAVLKGYTVLFTTASEMLNNLAVQDGDSALRRRLKHFAQPQLLVVDEVGYLSYSNRHADLLFDIVAKRYEAKSTIITTNKAFTEWNDIFPNASCVVSLVDRLVHHSEIVSIDADSYRLKEAQEQSNKRKASRKKEEC